MSLFRNSPQSLGFSAKFSKYSLRSGTIFFLIIITALLAFEAFNYSTTQYALSDVLGDLAFLGIKWATILSIAFCGIDFAGIARLFTPGKSAKEPNEAWYLFGAWLLAATMNATLTWWGVSMALANHPLQSRAILDATTLTKGVPVFVAVMVWLIRILVIGSLSMASERTFTQPEKRAPSQASAGRVLIPSPSPSLNRPTASSTSASSSFQPIRRQSSQAEHNGNRFSMSSNRAEPVYTEDDAGSESGSVRPEPVYQSMANATKPTTPRQF